MHHDFNCCVRCCHRCRLSFHGPRQDISRSKMHAHDEVLSSSCPRHEIAFRVLQWRRLFKSSRVHQSWIGSCWIRSGYHCRTRCLRNGLGQVSQGLAEALLLSFAAVACAATPVATADSDSSAQLAVQRVVLDPIPCVQLNSCLDPPCAHVLSPLSNPRQFKAPLPI